MRWTPRIAAVSLLAVFATSAHAQTSNLSLGEINVVATTPTLGSAVDLSKIPTAINRLGADRFENEHSANAVEAANKAIPSVTLTNQTGNDFSPDLQYRGFTASPLTGAPAGLAVYQNGVRINEAFGDNVHWDFIPTEAVETMDFISSNPIFGLNALGGAVNVRTKNGFTFQGFENETQVGSFMRVQNSTQWGMQDGNFGAYFALEGAHDGGFRKFQETDILRFFGDVGFKDEKTELHLNLTAAANHFSAPGSTPVDLLAEDWSNVFTTPQTDDPRMAMLSFQGSHQINETLQISGTAYYRYFTNPHVDGNGTDSAPCDDDGDNAGFLCLGGDDDDDGGDDDDDVEEILAGDLNGDPIPLSIFAGGIPGQIDRNEITTNSFGGSVQIKSENRIGGMENTFIAGVSLDHGDSHFTASSELGTVDPDTFVVTGLAVFQGGAANGTDPDLLEGIPVLGPVDVDAQNTYLGVYALNTLSVTQQLNLIAGARLNLTHINLVDNLDPTSSLNGEHFFSAVNPVLGATYAVTPDITVFGSWSRSGRAPTPLELGCSDPDRPCIIDAFLVSDPPLEQVVSTTFEAGIRGTTPLDDTSRLMWSLSAYRTDNENDILSIVSEAGNAFGYFQNAGNTRRQGIEAAIGYENDRFAAYASYAFIDATYQSQIDLAAVEGDPGDDAEDGVLSVMPGDHIGGIPAHRFKAGMSYDVNDKWTIGGDLDVVGPQFFAGDEVNENDPLPAYATVGLSTTYKVSDNVTLFGVVENLFNSHHAVFGTYGEGVEGIDTGAPESLMPGKPFAIYGGIKVTY